MRNEATDSITIESLVTVDTADMPDGSPVLPDHRTDWHEVEDGWIEVGRANGFTTWRRTILFDRASPESGE